MKGESNCHTMITRPAHLPTAEVIDAWPSFTAESPLRLLVSACLANEPCGVNGTSYGDYPFALRFLALPNVKAIRFCPEHAAFGTPRKTPDIHGGHGFDILDKRPGVRVMSDAGDDWTEGMRRAAIRMREIAVAESVHLALMMDISAACGTSAIYLGARSLKVYQRGPGVAAAAILRAGIPVVSQRDERTLSLVFAKLGASVDGVVTDGKDFYERDWYQTYFGGADASPG